MHSSTVAKLRTGGRPRHRLDPTGTSAVFRVSVVEIDKSVDPVLPLHGFLIQRYGPQSNRVGELQALKYLRRVHLSSDF